jgi:hypothetical protein
MSGLANIRFAPSVASTSWESQAELGRKARDCAFGHGRRLGCKQPGGDGPKGKIAPATEVSIEY